MGKYIVCVHYQADVHIEVEADSPEQAERLALTKAYTEVPDNLFCEVAYVEENESC